MEKLWEDELAAKDARIHELETSLRALQSTPAPVSSEGILDDQFVSALGQEIYSGEVSDRVLSAIPYVLGQKESIRRDPRTRALFAAITVKAEPSGRAKALSAEITNAAKGGKRLAKVMSALLLRHGYDEKSDNKHIRLEASPGYPGLEAITLPKTPGDHRGLKNAASEIDRKFGLGWIKRGAPPTR